MPPLPVRLVALGALLLALGGCDHETSSASQPAVAVPLPGSSLPVRSGLAGRLTRHQHANVVLDVLGVQLADQDQRAASGGIPDEKASTGLFRNGADGQAAADSYPFAFGKLAQIVAERADVVALHREWRVCSEASDACRLAWVEQSGRRLFRRPLTTREGAVFVGLHASALAEGLSFEAADRSVLEAMLQAPAFVFRLENELRGAPGEKRYLDGFELASRLSFFLWGSAPDNELLSLAEANTVNGTVAAVPRVREQAQRLLADPRARRMTREFILDFAEPERASFVGVTPILRAALADSMVATFENHLWDEQGQIKGLFNTTRLAFTPTVASLIGLTPEGEGTQVYDVSALPERVGWLTHPGFIAGFGDTDVGKIVHRGIGLMVKLMCRQPVQLPDGVAAAAGDFTRKFSNLTERERSEQRQLMAKPTSEGGSDNPACWGCHSQFEPLAYGFDRFDAAGRYLGAKDSAGRALPIDGWMTDDLSLPEASRERYGNMVEFMELAARSETIQACMAQHFLAFATGRASTAVESSFSHLVQAENERAGGTLSALIEAVATSELFRSQASLAVDASTPTADRGQP
ncbi:MAG: DUF1592 domain-containing protein [Polyangiaceae bacterium]|nr:DUF1592 domain-containing protein [Polyangiaceae bacterium]